MKPTKQTVYLPVKVNKDLEIECDKVYYETGSLTAIEIVKRAYSLGLGQFQPQEVFVFTPEQLNEYTTNVIKQALEIASENSEVRVTENALIEEGSCYTTYDDGVISVTTDSKSITNTFEETFKKFEV